VRESLCILASACVHAAKQRFAVSCFDYSGASFGERGGGGRSGSVGGGANSCPPRNSPVLLGRATLGYDATLHDINLCIKTHASARVCAVAFVHFRVPCACLSAYLGLKFQCLFVSFSVARLLGSILHAIDLQDSVGQPVGTLHIKVSFCT
jgi:hypothetical protein